MQMHKISRQANVGKNTKLENYQTNPTRLFTEHLSNLFLQDIIPTSCARKSN
jgi:hypothetical protein